MYLLPCENYFGESRSTLTGLFTLSEGIPVYVHKFEDYYGSVNPSILMRAVEKYEGVVHLRHSSAVGLPLDRKAIFSFRDDYRFVKIGKLQVPIQNVSYIEFAHDGINYILIPEVSVAAMRIDSMF